jgi:6-phosphofructokinase 1
VPSPFCTYSACALPAVPRSGPRNAVNLCHAFVSDDDRVMLKSIAYGNPTSAGAEDCDAECNFTPQWCANHASALRADHLWHHCGPKIMPRALLSLTQPPRRCIRAGPRSSLYFKPSEVKAAVVTCGGLCPGLNDVIRQIVITLESGYGVQDIVGIPYGYRGFFEEGLEVQKLTRKKVQNIHLEGGSVLGTSRGGGDVKRIVDSIIARGINALFVLGGNGTHAGAQCIYEECLRRGYDCAVVGVPKTIDNDILHVRASIARMRACVLACVLARAEWLLAPNALSSLTRSPCSLARSLAPLRSTRPSASTPPWRRRSARCAPPPSRPRARTAAWASSS